MTDIGTLSPSLTSQVLRLARLAVRFGKQPRRHGAYRSGILGKLGKEAHDILIRHRAWERRFITSQLREWRETRSMTPIRKLRRGLNIQMHEQELNHILSVLEVKRPCSLLVFGMGNDSILWFEANRGGQTLFVEDDSYWDRVIRERHPSLQSIHVLYGTRAGDWRSDMVRQPGLVLPAQVNAHAWDMILVDGPAAWSNEKPGRVQSILAARRLVADQGAILVHDCDRDAERTVSASLLGHMMLSSQVQSLRHYTAEADHGREGTPVRPRVQPDREQSAWPAAAFEAAAPARATSPSRSWGG